MLKKTDVEKDTQGVKCGEMFIFPEGNYSMICEFCGAKHFNFDILAEHVFDHLPKPPIHIKQENFSKAGQNDNTNENKSEVIGSEMAVVEYLFFDEEFVSTRHRSDEINRSKMASLNEEKNLKKISKSDHQCNFCGQKFNKAKALFEHESMHSGRMPYECQECLKPFSSAKALRIHGITHKDIERQMCSDCGRTFNNTGTLNIHIRERHLPDTDPRRFFPCRYCDNKFKTNHQLYSHLLKTHKKSAETFTCDHCQRDFKSKRLIFAHMDNVHSKMHMCSVCSKAFHHKAHRDDHENTHTGRRPHQCLLCPKEFMNKAGLTRHNKIHGDESKSQIIPKNAPHIIKSKRKYKFKCKICSKAFPYEAARDDHENIHTGRRPYQCRLCEKDYSTKRTFKYHIKDSHTNDDKKLTSATKELMNLNVQHTNFTTLSLLSLKKIS